MIGILRRGKLRLYLKQSGSFRFTIIGKIIKNYKKFIGMPPDFLQKIITLRRNFDSKMQRGVYQETLLKYDFEKKKNQKRRQWLKKTIEYITKK